MPHFFSILRLLISCPRLVFSIILLSQQHDRLPQPCNVYVCIDTDIDIHTHTCSLYCFRGLLCSGCCVLCWLLLNFLGLLPFLCASGSLRQPFPQHADRNPSPPPHTTACCHPSLVASRFSGGSTPSSSG